MRALVGAMHRIQLIDDSVGLVLMPESTHVHVHGCVVEHLSSGRDWVGWASHLSNLSSEMSHGERHTGVVGRS